MNIEIKPEETGGEIFVPPSKSISHRAIMAAALANGTSRIDHVLMSEDVRATIEAVKSFGADIAVEQESEDGLFTVLVTGNPKPEARDCLVNCEESGSTVRFILPIIAIDAENCVITGNGRLVERPLTPYIDIFKEQGFEIEQGENQLPLIISGDLKSGTFNIRGDISSQFITGLFFALPLLDGDSKIKLTRKLESKPYVDLTIEVLAEFGIEIEKESEDTFKIPGNQSYRPTSISIRGDFSQAAFWFVNGLINKKTVLRNISKESTQGDFQIVEILNRIGGKVSFDEGNSDWISLPSNSHSFDIDVSDIPDLVPILAIAAGLSKGITHLTGAKRLRYKESDRIRSTAEMLLSFGVAVEEEEDGLIIHGTTQFNSAIINSFNDHRIAIAAAIGSGRATGPVVIENAHCVNKSYPNFWKDFKDAGGSINELSVGE